MLRLYQQRFRKIIDNYNTYYPSNTYTKLSYLRNRTSHNTYDIMSLDAVSYWYINLAKRSLKDIDDFLTGSGVLTTPFSTTFYINFLAYYFEGDFSDSNPNNLPVQIVCNDPTLQNYGTSDDALPLYCNSLKIIGSIYSFK